MSGLFLAPEWGVFLLLAPATWGVLIWARKRREALLVEMLGAGWRRLVPELDLHELRRGRWLVAACVVAGVLAAMQPSWGVATRTVDQRGVDIVLCLDVSRSMNARDVTPSRLEHARGQIAELAQTIRFDRLALVVFAGSAHVACPLTKDMAAFQRILSEVDELSVARGGSEPAAALDVAQRLLEGTTGDHEVVVLVTDGEDRDGRARRAAEVLAKVGITLHCVAVGTSGGAKIPTILNGEESFLTDGAGRDVVTTADLETLKTAAGLTGGRAVRTENAGALIELHQGPMREMARKAVASERRAVRPNRYKWPLLIALLLGSIEIVMTGRRQTS